jgi:hypothetical protein
VKNAVVALRNDLKDGEREGCDAVEVARVNI